MGSNVTSSTRGRGYDYAKPRGFTADGRVVTRASEKQSAARTLVTEAVAEALSRVAARVGDIAIELDTTGPMGGHRDTVLLAVKVGEGAYPVLLSIYCDDNIAATWDEQHATDEQAAQRLDVAEKTTAGMLTTDEEGST